MGGLAGEERASEEERAWGDWEEEERDGEEEGAWVGEVAWGREGAAKARCVGC